MEYNNLTIVEYLLCPGIALRGFTWIFFPSSHNSLTSLAGLHPTGLQALYLPSLKLEERAQHH